MLYAITNVIHARRLQNCYELSCGNEVGICARVVLLNAFSRRIIPGSDSPLLQVIKTFSMREGWWYIGIKGGGGVKSKGTRIVIEKEK